MNRATSNRRLLKLADFLDQLPPERFDYAWWVGRDWKGAQDLSCGTTACALGWAATMPEFRRLGLRLEAFEDDSSLGVVVHVPTRTDGTDAAVEVFGLGYDEATFLFCPSARHPRYGRGAPGTGASAPEVAAHIRRFVEERV